MAQFNSPGAVILTAQYDLHRMRRKPENAFFSKRSIVALESAIYDHVERLCNRLEELKWKKSPLTINHAMFCFTGDVVSEYVFSES
jgi:cytochrome P450